MQHRESLFPGAGSAALKPQAEIRHARIIAFPKQTPFDAPQQPRHTANSLRRFANASVRSIHLIANYLDESFSISSGTAKGIAPQCATRRETAAIAAIGTAIALAVILF